MVCGDDPAAAALADRHGAITTYGLADDVDDPGGRCRRRRRRVHVHARTCTAQRLVDDRAAVAGRAQRGQRDRRGGDGDGASACRSKRSQSALARFGGVARRFDIRGVDAGATFVDDYAHLPTEIAAVLAAARGSGDGWQRVDRGVPTEPLQPDRRDLARLRRRVRRRRHRRAHRHLRVGNDADPGRHRQAARQRRAEAHPEHASCGCRAGTTSSASCRRRSGPATSASRWAAATSRTLPDEVLCSPVAAASEQP